MGQPLLLDNRIALNFQNTGLVNTEVRRAERLVVLHLT